MNIDNLSSKAQPNQGITYARKIDKSETQIDWFIDAREIHQRIRAFSPIPGAWFELQGERIKILESQISTGSGEPGLIIDDYFQIACLTGSIFPILLQRAGKSPISISEFRRGYKIPVGTNLVSA